MIFVFTRYMQMWRRYGTCRLCPTTM